MPMQKYLFTGICGAITEEFRLRGCRRRYRKSKRRRICLPLISIFATEDRSFQGGEEGRRRRGEESFCSAVTRTLASNILLPNLASLLSSNVNRMWIYTVASVSSLFLCRFRYIAAGNGNTIYRMGKRVYAGNDG